MLEATSMSVLTKTLRVVQANERKGSRKPAFNMLRWYSLISLAVIGTVAAVLGAVSTQFVIAESVHRDGLLTSQFIQAIASAEVRHVSIPNVRTMGELRNALYRNFNGGFQRQCFHLQLLA